MIKIAAGVEYLYSGASQGYLCAGIYGMYRDIALACGFPELFISLNIQVYARGPDFLDPDSGEQGGKAVHMVRVGMGKNRKVDRSDVPVPENRRHHPLSHIKTVVLCTSTVDDDPFPVSGFHEAAVSLADIEKQDPVFIAGQQRQDQGQYQRGCRCQCNEINCSRDS